MGQERNPSYIIAEIHHKNGLEELIKVPLNQQQQDEINNCYGHNAKAWPILLGSQPQTRWSLLVVVTNLRTYVEAST